MPSLTTRSVFLSLLAGLAWISPLSAADLTTWPAQFTPQPWEPATLTDADVVGPDGIVYPDFTGAGVTGGIPDINAPQIRATYTIFNVRTYGAKGDGVTSDDASTAAAASAALTHAIGGGKAILYFPAGSYLLSAPIELGKSNVVVDGDGPAATLIKLTAGDAKKGALFSFKQPRAYLGNMHLAATAPRGAKTLTFDQDPALNCKIGDWLRMLPTRSGPGTTLSDRFSNPDNHVIYTDAVHSTGRVFFAKVVSLDSTAKTVTFDRTLTHDYYLDEAPQLRKHLFIEQCGLQDLSIETLEARVPLDPVRFENAAESWIKNITLSKARNWPLILESVTRFEVRDSQFLGTWVEINNGSTAYFGWIDATDSLMDNVHARDLRHMAIFQLANRCVIRASTFTGRSITSPQLHGRFPHENLIEGSTFNSTGVDGKSSRSLSAYASDGASSLRHGVNGPRNVFYNNRTEAGSGSVSLGGLSEGLIFVYNRVLRTHDNESLPPFRVADRTFNTIVRGNIFQGTPTLPFISFEDPTCTGWQVRDNKIYGSNGYLFEGDSEPALADNNRFYPATTPPAEATTPEVPSIYAWQKKYAREPRLLLVIQKRGVAAGGTLQGIVVRINASSTKALTVRLASNTTNMAAPAAVTIPAGSTYAPFTLTGNPAAEGETPGLLAASAPGLLGDVESVLVLPPAAPDAPMSQALKRAPVTDGLPPAWKAADFGQITQAGTQTYTESSDTWDIAGAGVGFETYQGNLGRSGRHFVYQTLDGNGEIRARFTSSASAKQVGLMIADDEATLTDYIWIEPTGRVVSSSNRINSPHGAPVIQAPATTPGDPVWLRLQRTGSVFTAYRSTAETPQTEDDWTVLATVDMYRDSAAPEPLDYKSPAVIDRRMHYGLFLNSGSPDLLARATFTGVRISPAK